MSIISKVRQALTLARARQWLKNGFVAMPIFFGGRLLDVASLVAIAPTIIIFCLVSSAVYVLNDYQDREADAVHPKKRHRPLAAGVVSPNGAFAFLSALIAAAVILGAVAQLQTSVVLVIVLYVLVNIAYSFGLKHVSLIELFIVASGFVLRLLAGGFATELSISPWLLAMTGVIAMLIAAAKRRAEIAGGFDHKRNRRSLDGYNLGFLDSIISMTAGMTIVFYLLFALSEYGKSRYGQNMLLLTAPVLAYGVLRFVQLTKLFTGADDPTELIVRDRGIALSVLVFAGMYAVVIYVH